MGGVASLLPRGDRRGRRTRPQRPLGGCSRSSTVIDNGSRQLGRAASSAARLHEIAVREIVFRIPQAARALESNEVTVGKAARNLEKLGIVAETTGRSRNKRFVYLEYLRVIEEGTAG